MKTEIEREYNELSANTKRKKGETELNCFSFDENLIASLDRKRGTMSTDKSDKCDKNDPILPDTPPTTPTLESMQAREQPKTTIHRLAMASAAAMINQFQKMDNKIPPLARK